MLGSLEKNMMRLVLRVSCLTLLLLGVAAPASAQIVHSVTIGGGLFWPRGESSRVTGDVLVANLNQPVVPGYEPRTTSLEFEINDFRSFPVFGEYNLTFNDRVEVSFGVAYSQRTVDSVYRDFVNGERGGAEIEQELSLRMIPFTAVVKFLPFGDASSFQPYVGAGFTAVNFRYSETGEFVDPSDLAVFADEYIATGTAVGGLILGGIRMPIGGDVYAFQVEGRYQFVSGNTGGAANQFLGDKIDMSGGMLNFGFIIRF